MIDLPPPQYDFAYHGPVIEFVVPNVDEQCRRLPAIAHEPGIILGCSFKLGETCVIMLRERHPLIAQLRRHEIGHCNGWKHD